MAKIRLRICGGTIESEDVPRNVPRLLRGEHEVCCCDDRRFLVKEYWRCRFIYDSCCVRQGGDCTGSEFSFVCGFCRCYDVDECCS